VALLLFGPPFFPTILFLTTTLLIGMTGISFHMQWPLTSQSHGKICLYVKVVLLLISTYIYINRLCFNRTVHLYLIYERSHLMLYGLKDTGCLKTAQTKIPF
jgi:hypothetical protein